MKRVHVAVAVIVSPQHQILIAKRPDDKHQGGLWEFPGGKVEAEETTQDALVRELREEVGLSTRTDRMVTLVDIHYDYPDKQVFLDVWWVEVSEQAIEQAHGAEGQAIAWVGVDQLSEYEFPAANQPILDAIAQRFGAAF